MLIAVEARDARKGVTTLTTFNPSSTQYRRLVIALAAAVVLAFGVGAATSYGDQENQPIDFTHNVIDAPAPVPGGVFGSGPALRPGQRICSTRPQSGANADTDCE